MNNDITNPTPENEAELTEAAELLTSDQSEPAFDYQPPAVETPEPPTVADSVPVVETKVAFSPEDAAESVPEEPVGMDDGKSAASEKTAEAPVEQPVEQPVQQPVQQSVQQPVQKPVQQPVQQPYQQPVQQPYQQPVQQPYQQPYQQTYQQPYQQTYQQTYQQPYQQTYQQPSPGVTQQYYQYTPVNPAIVVQQNTSDGFAVASLICSIVGIVSCCTIIPSFLAVIFGAISKAKNDGTRPTGMSTAGLVLGIIGILLNLLVLLGMFYMD